MRQHILPTFGRRSIASTREPGVRAGRYALLESGASPVTVAKAYRLFKAILSTAVDDGLIRRNPCRIVGTGASLRELMARMATPALALRLSICMTPDDRQRLIATAVSDRAWEKLGLLPGPVETPPAEGSGT